MKFNAPSFVSTLAAILLLAAACFAGSTKSLHITLDHTLKLNGGAMLEPGSYTMKVAEDTKTPMVEFYTDGRLVAKVQGKVRNEVRKNQSTALEITKEGDVNVLMAVDPGGWREKLVFGTPTASTGS